MQKQTECMQWFCCLEEEGRRGRHREMIQHVPHIINYRGYFCTLKELGLSMKKAGWMKTHVFDLRIDAIMYNRRVGSKKIIMPVRFSIWLQKLEFDVKELHDMFNQSNCLDEQDMVMIHVLENLEPDNAQGPHYYWLFNINLRDKRFEVFDSWRNIKKSKRLDEVARAIVAAVRVLWDNTIQNKQRRWRSFRLWILMHQSRLGDCSIITLMNALLWNGTWLPSYEQSDIPNIRKKMTISMLKCDLNKILWQEILKSVKK